MNANVMLLTLNNSNKLIEIYITILYTSVDLKTCFSVKYLQNRIKQLTSWWVPCLTGK